MRLVDTLKKYDHQKILKTVLDNGGIVAGGYVREWVRFGEPQNSGWNDLDIFCEKKTKKHIIEKKLFDIGVVIDFRAQPPFNDYFCNCWMFDGKIKPVASTDKKFSYEEIKEQTVGSQAKMMRGGLLRVDKMISFYKNGWDIYFSNDVLATKETIIHFAQNPIIGITNINRVNF